MSEIVQTGPFTWEMWVKREPTILTEFLADIPLDDDAKDAIATMCRAMVEESLAPTVERLAQVRQYAQNNRDVWVDDADPGTPSGILAAAYVDIYQKILNVIDTGNPMRWTER